MNTFKGLRHYIDIVNEANVGSGPVGLAAPTPPCIRLLLPPRRVQGPTRSQRPNISRSTTR